MKSEQNQKQVYSEILDLNIGGKKFTLGRDLVMDKPNTKLAKLLKDEKLIINYSDSINSRQYYFDRNPKFFSLIQEWYRTNKLHMCEVATKDMKSFYDELEYWEISPSPIFDKLKNESIVTDKDLKNKVEIFIDTFLKRDLLDINSEKHYYNLFLQRYPLDYILMKRVHNADGATLKTIDHDLDLKLKSTSNSSLFDTIKIIAKNRNLPLNNSCQELCPTPGQEIYPTLGKEYSNKVTDLILQECKEIKDLHPVLDQLYLYCYFSVLVK